MSVHLTVMASIDVIQGKPCKLDNDTWGVQTDGVFIKAGCVFDAEVHTRAGDMWGKRVRAVGVNAWGTVCEEARGEDVTEMVFTDADGEPLDTDWDEVTIEPF